MSDKSLCWDCKRADKFFHQGLFCPWSANFTPVPGWSAVPTQIVSEEIEEVIDSFEVISCPLFTADRKGRNRK